MAWVILMLSGALEAVWAAALSASDGFRRKKPVALFLVTNVLSLAGLAWAMRFIPTGAAYAVWVGIGATLTAAWTMASRAEAVDVRRIALLVVLLACVVGLKVVG